MTISDNPSAKRITAQIPTASGDMIEAWVYLPEASGPHPAVVMAHGIRYDDMPPLPEAWRLGLEGSDQESRRRFGADFRSLSEADQDTVLKAIQAGDVGGAA
jgi:cephalosporin-C deacetylase-like acetyl esterase